MEISINIDASKALELVERQLPNAAKYVKPTMLTGLSKAVQRKIQERMPVAFDRPTPFTVRGVWIKEATKPNPKARVFFPESAENAGRGKREYIRPGAQGSSARRQKRTEALLVKAGVLPPGWVTVPGNYAMRHLLDGYGNMKGSYYAQIVQSLQLKKWETKRAKGIAEKSIKRAANMGVKTEFFAVTPGKNAMAKGGGWLPPGVYRHTGKGGRELVQFLKFVRKASYRPRLELAKIASAEVRASANAEFSKAWAGVIGRFAARKGITR